MTLTILSKTLMKNLIKTQTKFLKKKTPTKSLRKKTLTKTQRKRTLTKILRKNLKKILEMILLMSLMKKVTSM